MKKLKITQTNQPKKVKSFYEFTEKEQQRVLNNFDHLPKPQIINAKYLDCSTSMEWYVPLKVEIIKHKELTAKQIYDLYCICIDMLEIFEDSANLEAFTTEIKLMEQAGSYQPLFDHTAECFHNEIQKIINQ